MPPFRKPRDLQHLSFSQFDRALRPRRRRPRVSVPLDRDVAFITPEQLRLLAGYSSHYFYRKALPLPVEHGLPPVLVLGPDGVNDYRFSTDMVYRMYPELDPHRDPVTGKTTDWLTRFRAKSKSDAKAYLTAKSQKAVAA